MNPCAHCTKLRDECDLLAEQVRQLEEVLFDVEWMPAAWQLTGAEGIILNVLGQRTLASRETLHWVLYEGGHGGSDDRRLHVLIHHLRKKLAPHGLVVENVRGRGYRLDPASRLLILELRKAA